MWGCAEVRELLPLRFYDPPADESADPVAQHLRGCQDCAAAWEVTRSALASVQAQDAFPREAEVDWGAFARATVARARASEGARATKRARPWRMAIPAAILAAAACLVAVVALRVTGVPGPEPAAPVASVPGMAGLLRQSVAREAAARSLREGRALLVDLMQAPVRCRRGDGTLDIALEKERSRALLRRLAVHRGALVGPEDGRIADLMGQMQSLLEQVGTLDDCAGPHSLDELKDAIRRRQILLRIDLVTRDAEGGASRA
jgi:putative zinc finger protein